MRRIMHLTDTYAFPGFRPLRSLKGLLGDRYARIVRLKRRGKKLSAESAVRFIELITTITDA